ncbi:MAG TPA: hypothetical protein VFS30_16070 [Dehalococcoidia bacterium]|nr:hypothetical protein [Dehalococcoidia bacterium]
MQQITAPDESTAAGWERTLYAFLSERSDDPVPSVLSSATRECFTTSSAGKTLTK